MRKPTNTLLILSSLIIFLVLIAAGLGVFWQGEGEVFAFQSLRGETLMMHGHGLYYYETVSTAAQAIAQDVVTLLVGIPLLIIALVLYKKGSLRGQLLLAGTLGYFLYTYASYTFGAAYNVLFLLYVSLFSLSLFAFILSIMAIDVSGLPAQFTQKLPRRTIAVFMFVVGLFFNYSMAGAHCSGFTEQPAAAWPGIFNHPGYPGAGFGAGDPVGDSGRYTAVASSSLGLYANRYCPHQGLYPGAGGFGYGRQYDAFRSAG